MLNKENFYLLRNVEKIVNQMVIFWAPLDIVTEIQDNFVINMVFMGSNKSIFPQHVSEPTSLGR